MIGISVTSSPERQRDISTAFNKYVDLEFGVGSKTKDKEQEMQLEYEQYRHMRPILSVARDGALSVKGLKLK